MLRVVVELIKSNDGLVRDARVKVGKTRNIIGRPVNCQYTTEVRTTKQYRNIRNFRKTKKKGGGNDHSTKITYSKRDAAVAGELPQRLNNTNVDPQLVGGEKCKIYDRVIYLK